MIKLDLHWASEEQSFKSQLTDSQQGAEANAPQTGWVSGKFSSSNDRGRLFFPQTNKCVIKKHNPSKQRPAGLWLLCTLGTKRETGVYDSFADGSASQGRINLKNFLTRMRGVSLQAVHQGQMEGTLAKDGRRVGENADWDGENGLWDQPHLCYFISLKNTWHHKGCNTLHFAFKHATAHQFHIDQRPQLHFRENNV